MSEQTAVPVPEEEAAADAPESTAEAPVEPAGEPAGVERDPVEREPIEPEPLEREPIALEPIEREPVALIEPSETTATTAEVPVEPAEVPAHVVEVPVEPVAQPVAQPQVVAPPSQHVVYVEAPQPPAKKGNRGFGVLIAILSAVIFAVLYAAIIVLVEVANNAFTDFAFISGSYFWGPVAVFLIAFILLVLLVNRAGWAAHVLGSLFVGVVVYFGTAGVFLLIAHAQTPGSAATYGAYLFTAPTIAAALLAREVSLWMGAGIAARGRRVKVRNIAAREEYDRDEAAKRAEYERANASRVDGAPVAPANDQAIVAP